MGSYLVDKFPREQPCITVPVLGNEVLVRATANTRLTAGAPPADGVGCICCYGPTHHLRSYVHSSTETNIARRLWTCKGRWCPLDIADTENRPYSVRIQNMTLLAVEHGVRCPRYCRVNPRERKFIQMMRGSMLHGLAEASSRFGN